MANGQTIGKPALAAATRGLVMRYEELKRNRYQSSTIRRGNSGQCVT
jgi:hypothetical protein